MPSKINFPNPLFDAGQRVYRVRRGEKKEVLMEQIVVTSAFYSDLYGRWMYTLGLYNVAIEQDDIFATIEEAGEEYLKKKLLPGLDSIS